MNRRTFLKTGAATTALFCSQSAWCAQTENTRPTDADILAQTKEHIEQYRKGSGIIQVRDAQDRPIPGATVRVEQLRHDFLFGCNLFMFDRCGKPDLEELYRQRFAAVFNYCTLGFYWANYEAERGRPNYDYTDKVLAWTRERGIATKGHPLVWDHPAGSPRWLPDDPQEIERLSIARVEAIPSRFKGRIDIWDVVNEATHLRDKPNKTRMAEFAVKLGPVPYVEKHLKAARTANPQATLLVNDYRIEPAYYRILDSLRSGGRLLFDAVGIQSHMHDNIWPLAKVRKTCDTYKQLGLPLHFTETTLLSGPRTGPGENWGATTPEGEARQAELTANLYTVLFAHPDVQAVTWWDFSDLGAWQRAPAGWLRRDMSPKLVYERLHSLIKTEWWTKIGATTDARGEVKLRAFYGTQAITAETPGGKSTTVQVPWQRGKSNQFKLTA